MILAILSWNQMANIEFKNCYATKRKENLLKAQWVNETCRDLQAKLIKIAAFCHNRALKIFFRLVISCCLQQDLSHRQLHRFRVNPTSSAFNERVRKDRNLPVLVDY